MARDGDRNGSGVLSRIDRFVWIPVVPMLVLALVTVLMGVPLLGLMLLIGALVLVGFDLWVNSRRKSQPRRQPEPPRREPARRPARQAPPQRAAAPRGGAPRNGATRVANQPRRNPAQGSRPQQRPSGGRPGARR
ncbi:hypothetical protein AB0I53_04445 [Saccharopolyspora sp. NPDC050389]|uniref:hypothetical protein n=1 Tax=Saccharopolyspora sp. NPDC050389 TaxID=3155516 RepID=UPI0033C91DA6